MAQKGANQISERTKMMWTNFMQRRSLLKGAMACAVSGCAGYSTTLTPKGGILEPTVIAEGAGLFSAAGAPGRESSRIEVHYYRPTGFSPRSPILLVMPGDGRNASDYRDAWIAHAQSAGVLVAALGYPEAEYDFAAYQMGGVIKDVVIRNMPLGPDGQPPSRMSLRDEDISFALNIRPEQWLFGDFDRIFDSIVKATGSRRSRYDLFGHSAGGQILHRSVLFHPKSRADRIIAGNAGQYTHPDLKEPLPSGLAGSGMTDQSLAASFACKLILLLGEKDDASETRGSLLHTPTLDKFGVDRLSRGRHFFRVSEDQARTLSTTFNWEFKLVPNVGHDYRAMSAAAAQLLYGQSGGSLFDQNKPSRTAR